MKIIKRGKIEFEEKRFECERCGCEFLAEESDVKYTLMGDYVVCPTCGQYISWDC
jgi:transcription elongation factor Elf1